MPSIQPGSRHRSPCHPRRSCRSRGAGCHRVDTTGMAPAACASPTYFATVADGRARDKPVRLRRVGDGGQLGTRRVGLLRGAHRRRRRIDVERRTGQRVRFAARRTAGAGPAWSPVQATAATVRRGAIRRATAQAAEDITRGKLVLGRVERQSAIRVIPGDRRRLGAPASGRHRPAPSSRSAPDVLPHCPAAPRRWRRACSTGAPDAPR